MNDEQGMLVSRDWLTKVDKTLFHTENEAPSNDARRASLFYDIRPARLASAWQFSGGEWSATAHFITRQSVVSPSIVTVYAPSAEEEPVGTASQTKIFIVWRGRWEMLGGTSQRDYEAGNGVSILNRTIYNTGVREIDVGNVPYQGVVGFSSDDFKTSTNTGGDIKVKRRSYSLVASASSNVLTIQLIRSNLQ